MNDQQMNLRLYTPAGFRIEIPNAWEGSWNAFYDEYGDALWELYRASGLGARAKYVLPVQDPGPWRVYLHTNTSDSLSQV